MNTEKISAGCNPPELKSRTFKWRLIAAVAAAVWAVIFLLDSFIFSDIANRLETVFPHPVLSVFFMLSILSAVVLIIFPLQWYIYAFSCCLWGLIHFAAGETLLGFFNYILGLWFFYHQGFFSKATKRKLGVFIILFPAVLVFRFYSKNLVLQALIIKLLEFVLLSCLAFFLFIANFYKRAFSVAGDTLRLSPQKFTKKEVSILRSILAKEKYQKIASDNHISLSTVKSRAKTIYKKLGVTDARECQTLWQGWNVALDR